MTGRLGRWYSLVRSAFAARPSAGGRPDETAVPAAGSHVHAATPYQVPVAAAVEGGHVDVIAVHTDGTIAASGWSASPGVLRDALSLTIGGVRLPPSHAYRVRRPDLVAVFGPAAIYHGAVVEWIAPPRRREEPATLRAAGRVIASFVVPPIEEPAYPHLRAEPRVLHRDDIYTFGPPVPEVSVDVLELARRLPGPVLDFGCGAGALVCALRREGVEAYGLELDDDRIRRHLLEEARPWVTLYDGRLPSPFRDRQFRSVCCSEVLEHIPRPETVVAELARLASDRLLVTVPDISAIPRGFRHGVVPWHLLESTHVNFFTQQSLESLLAPVGSRVDVARFAHVQCERLSYYTNLAAVVHR